MFTGIIREIGKVKKISRSGYLHTIDVLCPKTAEFSAIGDSVAVNGVCLTVTGKSRFLSFDVVSNTLENTNIKRLKPGDDVNLENALKAGDDISGHMVSGHVDGERKVRRNFKGSTGWLLEVNKKTEDRDLIVPKGSVAVDGVSLTVADDLSGFFRVFLIPYTLRDTILSKKTAGSYVNIEFDMLGKYALGKVHEGSMSADKLEKKGFF
jgi:riboflavin synthase